MEKLLSPDTEVDHPAKAAITAILEEQARGWNNGDAEMYSRAFSEEGSFTNIFGMFHRGYEDFLRKHEAILNSVFKGSVFEYQLVDLKVIHENVAIAETLVAIARFHQSGAFNRIHTDANGRLLTRLLQVFVKEQQSWKIIAYHNIDIKEGITVPELENIDRS